MKQIYCVFNRTRESFLGMRVIAADTLLMRLKGALGRIGMRPADGIWLSPSNGIHTIGMLFAIDLVYLDAANHVIHLEEHFGPFRISPIRMSCASILQLESRAIYASNTKIGDELVICAPGEMNKYCGRTPTPPPVSPEVMPCADL